MPTKKKKRFRKERKNKTVKPTFDNLSSSTNDGNSGYGADDDDVNSVGSTPRRRRVNRAKERVKNKDIDDYRKLAALPRPSMPGDPPTIIGTRVGRFRLDLHDYEEWQGDVSQRVLTLGASALEQRAITGTSSTDERTAERVIHMGKQAYSLTKAVAYDTRSKATALKARQSLVEVGMMKPIPPSRGSMISSGDSKGVQSLAPPGQMVGGDPTELSDEDDDAERVLSSEDENAKDFMLDGLDTRELYNGGVEKEGGDDAELDSDEDWDTSEWGKEDVEQACVALLDEIETATTSKRHRLATMMLVKLIKKHDAAVDYLDGGMESLLDKGLRMQHHGITLASRNLTMVLAKVAVVYSLAERMSAMSCVIKCINCTNAVLDLAASVVQLRFRYRRYMKGRGLRQSVEVRFRNKMIMLQKIVETQKKFREIRLSDNGGEIPDEYLENYIELLANMTKPTHKRSDRDCSLVRRHGGMITLIRAIEYSTTRSVRAIACQALRHLCMQDGMTIHLLRAGAAHPLASMLMSKDKIHWRMDRNDGLEVLDLLSQRCFVTEKEMLEREDITLHWRDLCKNCGARCGKICKRPEYEASRYIGSDEIYEILLGTFLIEKHNAATRLGSLMILHKLASGPGTTDLCTVLTLGRKRPGILKIHAIRGRGLPNADDYSAMDPYVKVTMTTPHQPNFETGRDHTITGKTKPAMEAGMHPTWDIDEHNSIIELKYDAPQPLNDEDRKKAEHAAWLLGNENGLCTSSSLNVEVVDFDFVGDHDMVSYVELDIDDILNRSPLVRKEQWYVMTPQPVDLRMGDEPPKPHFGRFGTGGQLRFALQFIPNGAGAKRRVVQGPPSQWARRGQANSENNNNYNESNKSSTNAANDRPVALECLIACMQSEAPGEAAIALATFTQLCYGCGGASGVRNRESLISAGALELLLPLCFDSTCEMPSEPPALEVLEALKNDELKNSFVSAPLSCDDTVFLTSLSALVCLAGSPSKRRTELVDITMSNKELADLIRKDLMFILSNHTRDFDPYLKKTRNDNQLKEDSIEMEREGPGGLRLLSIGALPFVLRFLIMGETMGEDPNQIEEAYGGYLSTDQFIRMHGTQDTGLKWGGDDGSGSDLFDRRTERRRISSIILYRLMLASSVACNLEGIGTMTAKEVTGALYLPSVVYFLTMVIQENQLSQLSGETKHLIGKESRYVYHMSTEASMLALVNIARLSPDGDIQPKARYDVAQSILTHHAMSDIIGLAVVPVETSSSNQNHFSSIEEAHDDFRWQVRGSMAAIRLLVSCLPRVDEEGSVPDEQTLEVEALRAVIDNTPDGQFLTKCAKESIGPLIRILLLAGAKNKNTEKKSIKIKNKKRNAEDEDAEEDLPAFTLPDLLVVVSFGLSRICCTEATSLMAFKMNIIPALSKIVPTIPRLGKDFRTLNITKSDYRPTGALMGSTVASDLAMLLQLPASVVTLLAALARVRVATEDICGCGFLERMIERFYTASTANPENDLKVWGECALFFGRIARGGKNVKGYGSCNEVLVRCAVIPKLISMFSRQQNQHRRVRLHAMLAVSALLEDGLMSAPIVMTDDMPLRICMMIATDPIEIEPIRRQALLIIRSIASFPNGRYNQRLIDLNVISPLQSIGRSFSGEVGSSSKKTKKERKQIQTGSGAASSDPNSLNILSLGQVARDILENLGASIEEDEKKDKIEPEVTPWGDGIEKGKHWVPFKERNLTDFEREALFYEKEAIKLPPIYVCGETVVYDFGRYEVMRIDDSPNPPDVPLYDLAHAKTDTMGLVVVDDNRFNRTNVTDDDIHLFNIPENKLTKASIEEGGLPDLEGRGGKKNNNKKKKEKKHQHDEERVQKVMIHEKPEALLRTLKKQNPHYLLQQSVVKNVPSLTPRKSEKKLKLYQMDDITIDSLLLDGSISKDDLLINANPLEQATEEELNPKSKKKKIKKIKKLLPSEKRKLKRLNESKKQLIHCQIDGCQFRAKSFAHLSLHCALTHFRSENPPSVDKEHDDDGLLDLRAPPDGARLRMLKRAQQQNINDGHTNGDHINAGGAAERQRQTSKRRRRKSASLTNDTDQSSKNRFRPVLLDPVFPPVAPPGGPPTLLPTKEPKWPLIYDYMEHRVELSGHEISVFTSTSSRPNSKRDAAPWKGARRRK